MDLLDLKLGSEALLNRRLNDGRSLAEALDALNSAQPALHERLTAQRGKWPLGWLDLPWGGSWVEDCNEQALRLIDSGCSALLVCGIGGSALGTQAVYSALDQPGRPLRPLLVVDNVDPGQIARLLEWAELKSCGLNVISKSGETLETMAAFFHLLQAMEGSGMSREEIASRVIATTDPLQGLLRELAGAQGWQTLPVPGDVGGRFSVFTSVGLLPLAFAGVDIESLLSGAREFQQEALKLPQPENPAWQLAALHYILHLQGGISATVQYVYGDGLVLLGDWLRQLWAESLAKATMVDGSDSGVGQTPVVARGSTDQHSQNQLYMEGPDDKLYGFVTAGRWAHDPPLALPEQLPEKLDYIRGHSFGSLLDACYCGTRDALVEAGRPVYETTFPQVDAEALGAWMQLWMLATAYAGLLYNVNPFDQPGVERSKVITRERLTR
ncbi:glucose-6-phosphate isomerase [bacterium]|nr:glucose-6-phosphate isomerase [bacterium]